MAAGISAQGQPHIPPACVLKRCFWKAGLPHTQLETSVGAPGFPGGSDHKDSAYRAGDLGLIPESGRSLGEGPGDPLQYSCLENPMDRGASRATVSGVGKSRTRLSDEHLHFSLFRTKAVMEAGPF